MFMNIYFLSLNYGIKELGNFLMFILCQFLKYKNMYEEIQLI